MTNTTPSHTVAPPDLAASIADGELIPLLCAVAEISGERSLLDDQFRPRLQAEMITVPANGGLSDELADDARHRILSILQKCLADQTLSQVSSNISRNEIIDFLSAGASDHAELLLHELGGETQTSPWSRQDLAPTRPFVVGIIGAGPSGLAMAHELQARGIDFEIFDTNDSVGGTWTTNTYPGCRLDTGRLSYSFSYAQRHDWRHHFTIQPDLKHYYKTLAHEDGLEDHIHFGTTVTEARFIEDKTKWKLLTQSKYQGERVFEFDAIVSAVGILNQPRIPKFQGMAQFAGKIVHSARWPENLRYEGKRVAIIGTGASAYQIAPAIASDTSSLTVFQRSAPWMLPTPTYHAKVSAPAQWLLDRLPNYHRWLRLWEFWHSTIGKYALTVADPEWDSTESVSAANERFRNALVDHVGPQYADRPDLLEAVLPTYPVGAKRMLRDNGIWGEMLHDPRVTLVTDGIKEFTRDGILTAAGQQYDCDLIVLATGFDAVNYLGTVEVLGRQGLRLRDFWGDEPRAYLGISIPDFPNLFCLGGPNTALVAIGSQTFMTESAVHYVSECIRILLAKDAETIEPSMEAYHAYCDWVEKGNRSMAWGAANVNSWYRNSRGTVTASWPYPLLTYWDITRSPDPTANLLDRPALQLLGEEG